MLASSQTFSCAVDLQRDRVINIVRKSAVIRPRALLTVACLVFLTIVCTAPRGQATDAPATPTEALARGGLELPAGATGENFTIVTDTPHAELYRVSFTASLADVRAFCHTGRLGGDLPAITLGPQETSDLGAASEVETGSRICGSIDPGNTAWSRTVLIGGTDPATVRVAVARMGR